MKWTTEDGRTLNIKDMETSHLINTIRYIERMIEEGDTTRIIGAVGYDKEDAWADEIDISEELTEAQEAMRKELKKRGITV